MSADLVIRGARVALRPLTVADVTGAYVRWMNDPEVNRFMETRWTVHDQSSVEMFVADKAASLNDHLLAIVELASERHVGNLKIGPVDARHRTAWLSYFIGERSAWGGGLAGEAVALAARLAFGRLDLIKLNAGVYAPNLASARVLEKAGFVREGVRSSQFAFEGRRVDGLDYGLVKPAA